MILNTCDKTLKITGLRNYSIPEDIINGLDLFQTAAGNKYIDYNIVLEKGYMPHNRSHTVSKPSAVEKNNSIIFNDSNYRIVFLNLTNTFYISLKLSRDFIVYNLFQSLNAALSIMAILSGGLSLHAAGITSKNKSFIFCGKSGSGKSTLASKLCPPCKLIHDDFILLFKKCPSTYIPFFSPFGKDNTVYSADSNRLPIGEIYFNNKGNSNRVSALGRGQIFRKILLNSYISPDSGFISNMVLENAQKAASEIKGFDIFTLKTASNEECLTLIQGTKQMKYCTDRELTEKCIEDQLFILDRNDSVLHTFNTTGRFLWEKLMNGTDTKDLPALLCEEFETDPETAVKDAGEFIDILKTKRLVKPERKQE